MKLVYKQQSGVQLISYSTTKTVLRGKTLVERQLLQPSSDSVTDSFLVFQLGFSYWLALQQMDPPRALQDKSTMLLTAISANFTCLKNKEKPVIKLDHQLAIWMLQLYANLQIKFTKSKSITFWSSWTQLWVCSQKE